MPFTEQFGPWLRVEVQRRPWSRKGDGEQCNQWQKPPREASEEREPTVPHGTGIVTDEVPILAKNMSGNSPSGSTKQTKVLSNKDTQRLSQSPANGMKSIRLSYLLKEKAKVRVKKERWKTIWVTIQRK